MFLPMFQPLFAILEVKKYSNFTAPASLKKNNHGKYRSVHLNNLFDWSSSDNASMVIGLWGGG